MGDTITTTGKVKNIREEKGIVTLETVCTKQDRTVTLTGEAMVMILK